MANDNGGNGEYVVANKPHVRTVGDEVDRGGEDVLLTDVETFDVGDTIEPTDAELEAFPDRFIESDAVKSADEGEGAATTESDTGGKTIEYSEEQLDEMTYSELRGVAADVDSVSGSGSADEIRTGLKRAFGYESDDESAGDEESGAEE